MEPCYEDHPVNPWDGKWTRQRGYFSAYDVRARVYRGIFAGACGVTYGHHQIWQFLNPDLYKPINVGDTLIPWQNGYACRSSWRNAIRKKPDVVTPLFHEDCGSKYHQISTLVETTRTCSMQQVMANGSYAMIYLPQNKPGQSRSWENIRRERRMSGGMMSATVRLRKSLREEQRCKNIYATKRRC